MSTEPKRTYGVQGASGGSGWDQGQMWGSGLVTTPYKDYEIGTECTTDDEINFNRDRKRRAE